MRRWVSCFVLAGSIASTLVAGIDAEGNLDGIQVERAKKKVKSSAGRREEKKLSDVPGMDLLP